MNKHIKNKQYFNSEVINSISPSLINYKNINYLQVNEEYFTGLMVINYPYTVENNLLNKILYHNLNITISMFYEKLNSYDVIKKLTYHIGNLNTDMKISSENKIDYEFMNTTYNDARNIRKELQINEESLYNYYMYLTIHSKDLKELSKQLFELQSILYSLGFISKVPYFRHIDLYKTILPINYNPKELKINTKRNILTKTLGLFYPFVSSFIFDATGVLFGQENQCKSLVIIDRFDRSKYLNSNMCILGVSGAGKSFFVKLQILRNSLLNIKQLIIDPEGEYKNICSKVNGTYLELRINSKNYLNVFDIYGDFDINNESLLKEKIHNLLILFSIIIPGLSLEDKNYLEDCLINIYEKKGITFDNSSLMINKDENHIYIKPKSRKPDQFPIFEDLYNVIDKEYLKMAFKPFVSGSFAYFNHYTNFDIDCKTIIVDFENVKDEYIDIFTFAITEFFWNVIKNDKEKKIIYIDEIWKLISKRNNKFCADFVVDIFKTIRKYNGGATAITQDVSDMLQNKEIYGQSIMNNSHFKCIFKLDEENIHKFQELVFINENEIKEISNIQKGECLLMVDKNNLILNINCSKMEKEIIDGENIN